MLITTLRTSIFFYDNNNKSIKSIAQTTTIFFGENFEKCINTAAAVLFQQ